MSEASLEIALEQITKKNQNGADYYSITTELGELSISQHQALVAHVADTLQKFGIDTPILANSGIMATEKTVAIPASIVNALTDAQKKELFEPIFAVVNAARDANTFFKDALKESSASHHLEHRKGDLNNTRYVIMYPTAKHSDAAEATSTGNRQVKRLIETINRLVGSHVAYFNEDSVKNEFWTRPFCINSYDMPLILASAHRDEIFNAIQHPNAITQEKGFLQQLLYSGKGGNNRPNAGSWSRNVASND